MCTTVHVRVSSCEAGPRRAREGKKTHLDTKIQSDEHGCERHPVVQECRGRADLGDVGLPRARKSVLGRVSTTLAEANGEVAYAGRYLGVVHGRRREGVHRGPGVQRKGRAGHDQREQGHDQVEPAVDGEAQGGRLPGGAHRRPLERRRLGQRAVDGWRMGSTAQAREVQNRARARSQPAYCER